MAFKSALTDAAIRAAKPGEKPYQITDGHGLYLLVQPAGGKLCHYRYNFQGKPRLISLGPYPKRLERERSGEKPSATGSMSRALCSISLGAFIIPRF